MLVQRAYNVRSLLVYPEPILWALYKTANARTSHCMHLNLEIHKLSSVLHPCRTGGSSCSLYKIGRTDTAVFGICTYIHIYVYKRCMDL